MTKRLLVLASLLAAAGCADRAWHSKNTLAETGKNESAVPPTNNTSTWTEIDPGPCQEFCDSPPGTQTDGGAPNAPDSGTPGTPDGGMANSPDSGPAPDPTPLQDPECWYDSECGECKVCSYGRCAADASESCQPPPPPPTTCDGDNDCGERQVCVCLDNECGPKQGVCVPEDPRCAETNIDCPAFDPNDNHCNGKGHHGRGMGSQDKGQGNGYGYGHCKHHQH